MHCIATEGIRGSLLQGQPGELAPPFVPQRLVIQLPPLGVAEWPDDVLYLSGARHLNNGIPLCGGAAQ